MHDHAGILRFSINTEIFEPLAQSVKVVNWVSHLS